MVGGGRRNKESFSPLPVSQGGAGGGLGDQNEDLFLFFPSHSSVQLESSAARVDVCARAGYPPY